MTPTIEAVGAANISVPANRWSLNVTARAPAFERRRIAVSTVQAVLGALPHTTLFDEKLHDSSHFAQEFSAEWSGNVVGTEQKILQELVARLADVEDVLIQGPYWSLLEEQAAQAKARALGEAAINARNDATSIARALGGNLGSLISASTNQPGAGPRGVQVEMMSARASSPASVPERTLELELAPEPIEVQARVTASFEFLAG